MEFSSQKELYLKLIPVFNVKDRLIKYSKYKNLTRDNIWNYLIENKWLYSHNLTIQEIVNDIITVELDKINLYKKESLWKKENLLSVCL